MSRTASTDELYFVTLTVIDWIDVFTRRIYSDLIVENLTYCQQYKGLSIYTYVIMTNHIHLVANAKGGSLGNILRDFKTYTSKEMIKLITDNQSESRRDWMIKAFKKAGKLNPLNKDYQFWQNGNYPVCCIQMQLLTKRSITYTKTRLKQALLVRRMNIGIAALIPKVR